MEDVKVFTDISLSNVPYESYAPINYEYGESKIEICESKVQIDEENLYIKEEIKSDDEEIEEEEEEHRQIHLIEPKREQNTNYVENQESESVEFTEPLGSNCKSCKVCRLTFSSKKELYDHLKKGRDENNDKICACCACSKIFRDMYQLHVHMRKHTGEKPYECKICGKNFSISGNLKKHIRTHTGERRFECNKCEKKFTQLVHLQDHLKTHSGSQTIYYSCNIYYYNYFR